MAKLDKERILAKIDELDLNLPYTFSALRYALRSSLFRSIL